MKIRHHFTTAYCPWANGTIERLCKKTLRNVHALLSERKMPTTGWPSIVDTLQKAIYQSPLQRLGKNKDGRVRSAMELFTELNPSSLLLHSMLEVLSHNASVKCRDVT